MNRRVWALVFGVSFAVAACRSAGTSAPPPGPPPAQPATPTGGPPTAPNPAPAPPPVISPVPTPAAIAPASASSAAAGVQPAVAGVPTQPAISAGPPRPYQDILKLKQAGLSDEFLLNKVHTDNVPYQLTTSEIVELRAAGVSETVLQAMMRSGQPDVATTGQEIARKAEFSGLARVGKGFLVFGTSAKKTGRLVVDGENVSWFDAEDPKKNFSIYARSIKEVFNTCLLRPGQNLCLEFGIVTHTGEEYRFRDPGWKNGDNKLVLDVTAFFRQAFPNLFFSQRAVSEM
jgi:hypothetical protein